MRSKLKFVFIVAVFVIPFSCKKNNIFLRTKNFTGDFHFQKQYSGFQEVIINPTPVAGSESYNSSISKNQWHKLNIDIGGDEYVEVTINNDRELFADYDTLINGNKYFYKVNGYFIGRDSLFFNWEKLTYTSGIRGTIAGKRI